MQGECYNNRKPRGFARRKGQKDRPQQTALPRAVGRPGYGRLPAGKATPTGPLRIVLFMQLPRGSARSFAAKANHSEPFGGDLMICKKCGRQLPDDAKFCGVCGTPSVTLADYTAGIQPAPPVNTQPERPAAPASPDAPAGTQPPVSPAALDNAPAPAYTAPQAEYTAQRQSYAPPVRPAGTQPQPGFGAAPAAREEKAVPLTVGQFLLQDLAMMVPILNLVLLIMWGFGDANPNRRNWALSRLIWLGIGLAVTILVLLGMLATR